MIQIKKRTTDIKSDHFQFRCFKSGFLKACLLVTFLLAPVFTGNVFAQTGPSFVPDRPGYSDATASVDRGHWHLELGGSWLPEQDSTASALLRYGLGKGWELRLTSPTLTQAFPYTDLTGQEINPDLLIGGTLFGSKWAKTFKDFEFSIVAMLGLPLSGTAKAFTPDPLFMTTSQMSHSFNAHLSTGLALKYALTDGYIEGQDVAYAEKLAHLFGMMASLTWSDIGWSMFTQAGAEIYAGTLTPLVGTGLTLRVSQGSQVDFSLDAPLASDGVAARYMMGFTLAW